VAELSTVYIVAKYFAGHIVPEIQTRIFEAELQCPITSNSQSWASISGSTKV
jgi:hypothetical protein